MKKRPRLYLAFYRFGNDTWPVHIKIGVTSNVRNRLNQLQTPEKSYNVLYCNCSSVNEARSFEKSLLDLLSDFRLNGEWVIATDSNRQIIHATLNAFEETYKAIKGEYPFDDFNPKREELQKKPIDG